MHPAFALKNIRRLPASQARVAMAACRRDRSVEDLLRVEALLESVPKSQKILLLPVMYACLDPAEVPVTLDLDSFETEVIAARIQCAVASLRMIFDIIDTADSALELGPVLWPRVWAWVHFLHENYQNIPLTSADSETGVDRVQSVVYLGFVVFAGMVYEPPSNSALISSTPGFRAVLCRSLYHLPNMLSRLRFEGALWYISILMGDLKFASQAHFIELVDGAGGTLNDVAFLFTKYLKNFARPIDWQTSPPGFFLRSLIRCLRTICGSDLSRRHDLLEALYRQDFFPDYIATLQTIHDSYKSKPPSVGSLRLEAAKDSGKDGFEFLEQLLSMPQGHRWMPKVIRAGLLRTMVRFAMKFPSELDQTFQSFLKQLFPRCFVYSYVVDAMHDVLNDLMKLLDGDGIELHLKRHWLDFLDLAAKRIKLRTHLDEVISTKLKACDNLDCGKIQDRSLFQRCSGCLAFYYCNRECQSVDWTRGGHRQRCGNTKLLLADSPSCPLGRREREFLRALMKEAYDESLNWICEEQVMPLFVQQQVFTLIDFTCSPPRVSIQSSDESSLAESFNAAGPEWADICARARTSHGRMQIHVVHIAEGKSTLTWVVPLRSSTAYLHNALTDIADNVEKQTEFPADEDISAAVESVLQAIPSDFVEIH
ncbi:hypothetical protein R3P38DRAFT_2681268 [Favolaschia claudopus]|uniref:MYND-type domain-containing protein n=1 Tax=Favolaschia claudopus TaxID=2862362 RepID=A0AAW0E306_9AGAR